MSESIINQRMFAKMDGDFVVFLIGMRVDSFWKIHKWLPVILAMFRMLKELKNNPESGFLGVEKGLGNPTIMIQYWRSFEHLEAYARNKSQAHYPEWIAFNKKIAKSGDVGIWHETYKISAGSYENMCLLQNTQ